jgi:hypothetical protein
MKVVAFKKAAFAVYASVALVFSQVGVAADQAVAAEAAAASFKDVKSNHWAAKEIATAVETGYVDGFPDGTFKPEADVTRAEFIKMLSVAVGLEVPESTPGSKWYAPYVQAATEAGVVSKGQFNDGQLVKSITRAEMAQLAVRASNPAFRGTELNDNGAMHAAVRAGFIKGVGNGELEPQGLSTRAQSVAIVNRVLKSLAGEKLDVDKAALNMAELALMKTNIKVVMPEFFGKDGHVIWDPNNLTIESADGLYKGEVLELVAIDLDDPKDPNRNRFGKLVWAVNGTNVYEVDKYKNAYLLIAVTKLIYNKDTEKYGNRPPEFSIVGVGGGSEDTIKGKLDSIAPLGKVVGKDKYERVPGFIIPKKGLKTNGSFTLRIEVPNAPGVKNVYKDLVTPQVPTEFK